MGQYVDSNLLNMANPANSKNGLQAIGDGFKEMYNNYVRTRLSQNEIDLSDLRLGYERATQDDRIRAIKLGTENLANEVRKSAVDANIAEETRQDKIIQEKTKTANDLEILKQNQITSYFMPKKYQADINHSNASANNLWMNARATKQSIFLRDQAYKEQEEAKKVMSDFNEFSLKYPNLKGDDLKNAYYQYLNHMQMASLNDPLVTDTPTRIMNAQKYLEQQRLFEKHLGYAGQNYRANEDNFNPIPKGGNNSVNASAIIGANLNEIRQAKEKKQILEQEISKNDDLLDDLKDRNSNDPRIKELEQKRQELLATKQKLDGFISTSQTPIFNYDLLSKEEAKVTRNTENEVIDTLRIAGEIDEYLDFLNGKYVDKNGNKGQKFWTPNSGFWNNLGDKIVAGQGASENVRRFNALMTSLSRRNGSMRLKTEIDFLKNSITDPSDWWSWSSQVKNDLGRMKQSLINGTLSEVERYKSTNPVFYDYITMKYPMLKLN